MAFSDPKPVATQDELREQFKDNQIQFLLTELNTAMTFCDLAETTSDRERKERNIANACTGYQTAMRLAEKAQFDERSKEEFETTLARLREHLRKLGQEV